MCLTVMADGGILAWEPVPAVAATASSEATATSEAVEPTPCGTGGCPTDVVACS
jgi:hypothetical protein